VIPSKVRSEVAGRSGGWCEIDHPNCLMRATQMHHVLRRSQGGKDDADNLLHLCLMGHDYIHANPALSYESGWLKRSGIQ
jgi:hypothetical protein